jgi:hypothetical protein
MAPSAPCLATSLTYTDKNVNEYVCNTNFPVRKNARLSNTKYTVLLHSSIDVNRYTSIKQKARAIVSNV